MLGFILSKMNLLIMVTAITAIVAYFAFFLGQSVALREASAMLNRFSEDTQGVLTSSGQCHQTIISVPPYIHSVGTGDIYNQLRFLIHVDKIGLPDGRTQVSFSVVRKKDGVILAAKPFVTSAKVQLYNWTSSAGGTGSPGGNLSEGPGIELNPVAVIPEDSILLVKEVYNGVTYLYVVPCSSTYGFCSANFGLLHDIVIGSRAPDGGFNCVAGPSS